ncbi:MAG TPA: hypothetical protein VN153_00355 [Tahibacter sp.]|nr:hypothetical protein [Tahibacter sp.]
MTQQDSAAARGSLGKGIGFGLLALLGGHFVMWAVLPSLHPFAAFVTFLVAPWIALAAIAVHFLRRSEPRTIWGLVIAAGILVGLVALLIGIVALMFAQGPGHF